MFDYIGLSEVVAETVGAKPYFLPDPLCACECLLCASGYACRCSQDRSKSSSSKLRMVSIDTAFFALSAPRKLINIHGFSERHQ